MPTLALADEGTQDVATALTHSLKARARRRWELPGEHSQLVLPPAGASPANSTCSNGTAYGGGGTPQQFGFALRHTRIAHDSPAHGEGGRLRFGGGG